MTYLDESGKVCGRDDCVDGLLFGSHGDELLVTRKRGWIAAGGEEQRGDWIRYTFSRRCA